MKRLTGLQISFFLVSIASFLALYLSKWKPLKIQGIGGGHNYADLTSVLNAARCYTEIGSDVYSATDRCAFQYGLFLLRIINTLQLSNLPPLLLGGFFFAVVAIFLSVVGTTSSISRKHAAISLLILLSPGPWLLFERGNLDLLIIILIVAMSYLVNTRFSLVGAFLLIAASLMKFYTFPLLFMYIIFEKNKWNRVAITLASIAIIPLIVSDILSAQSHPNPMFAAFGLPLPGLWINFFAWRFDFDITLSILAQYVVGLLVFLFAFLLYRFSTSASRFRSLEKEVKFVSRVEKNVFYLFSTTYVVCFLAGSNFDYRLIFLAVSLILFNKACTKSMQSTAFLVMELAALWLTYFYFGATGAIPVLLSIAGNAAQLFLAVFLVSFLASQLLPKFKVLVTSRLGFSTV